MGIIDKGNGWGLWNGIGILFWPVIVFYFEFLINRTVKSGWNIWKIVFSLVFSVFLTSVFVFMGNYKFSAIGRGILIMAVFFLFISQYVYYRIFQTIYVSGSLGGAKDAMSFFSVAVSKMKENVVLTSAFFLPFLLYLFLEYKQAWSFANGQTKWSLGFFATAMLLTIGSFGISYGNNQGVMSSRYLLFDEFVPDTSLKRFGLITTMGSDVRMNLLGWKINPSFPMEEKDTDLWWKQLDGSPSLTLPQESSQEGETLPPTSQTVMAPIQETSDDQAIEYNVPPMWQHLPISFSLEEKNKTYLEMNQYFSAQPGSKTNLYTGIWKNKNLILITAEGFSPYAIDPVLTPTLAKLYNEGIKFSNFYTPLWGVSTSDGEFVATTGLLPKAGIWSYKRISLNQMPFGLGNQFSRQGYLTQAYHNHTYTYYSRDKSYPVMGYDYKGLGNGLEVTATWPESDIEMMDLSLPDFSGKSPFHVYYLTVSGHLEYTWDGNFIANKNKSKVEYLAFPETVKAYLATQIELDLALEHLLAALEKAGSLQDTVIALSADHYPYGLELKDYQVLASKAYLSQTEVSEPFSLYKNAFFLWTPDLKSYALPKEVKKGASSLDIAPTLSNLFGLPFDSRLFMGADIFSDQESLIIFQDRSFVNNDIMYNANSGEITYLNSALEQRLQGDGEAKKQYLDHYINKVKAKFYFSSLIIEKDYYQYLGINQLFSQKAENENH